MHHLLIHWNLELVVDAGAIRRLCLAQFPSQIEALVPQTLQTAETHLLLALVCLNPNAGPPVSMAAIIQHGTFRVSVLGQHGAVALRQELQGIHRLSDDVAVQVHTQLALPVALIAAVVLLIVLVLPGAVGRVAVHLRLGHGLVGSVLCDLAQVEQRLSDQLVVVLVLLSGAVAGADGAAVVVVVLQNWNEL